MLIPRPYQQEGTAFLWKKKRALLIDSPGLGKTLQAMNACECPTLVACPTYLVEQWSEVLQSQFPTMTVASAPQGAPKLTRLAALSKPADWFVVNIEMLRSYNFSQFKTFIIDESHHVRGRHAQQTKAALEIAKTCERVYLLTATPIYKDIDDLYAQLQIIDPKTFTSYYKFVKQFCNYNETPYGITITGAKSKLALRVLLSRYAIGRSYRDVGLQLPDLIDSTVKVRMQPAVARNYNDLRRDYRLNDITFSSAGALLQGLRQFVVATKLDGLQQVIADIPRGTYTIVFTWYRESAFTIAKMLNTLPITGDISIAERLKIAKAGLHTIVATMASMSEGIDLSTYKNVIFFEQDYTYGMMHQALSRVRRYSSQPSPVHSTTLLVKGTVDEIINRRLNDRTVTEEQILREALNG